MDSQMGNVSITKFCWTMLVQRVKQHGCAGWFLLSPCPDLGLLQSHSKYPAL